MVIVQGERKQALAAFKQACFTHRLKDLLFLLFLWFTWFLA
jgi:hypothetical protein